MRKSPVTSLAVLSGAALLLCDSKAVACSGPNCADVAVVGSVGREIAMGSIPANTPGIGVGIGDSRQTLEEPFEFVLKETSSTTTRDVALAWQADESALLLSGPLTPGSTVELDATAKGFSFFAETLDESEPSCEFPLRGRWQVTEEAALPTELGTLSATYEKRTITLADEGCFGEYEASTARVSIEHAASAEPWLDLLSYETWVDGVRWQPSVSLSMLHTPGFSFDEGLPSFVPGGSNIAEARGEDLLATRCEPGGHGKLLQPGKHSVEMKARLPGTDIVLTTGSTEIDLPSCTNTDPEDAGTPELNGPDVAEPSPVDGDNTVPGWQDSDSQEPKVRSEGCSTATFAAGAGPSVGSLAWLLTGLLALSRRRSRRPPPSSSTPRFASLP